ncbi:hypothetical protein MTR_5g066430 [Medicago truncatula]|uniref:Uncharacterized protein n=1 Tax=Medicago truncatula TaxID=3880 RepID=G7JYE7_MEDTR|nr:hypothetical protein MTR_5g066430 [Medicago truncatula]
MERKHSSTSSNSLKKTLQIKLETKNQNKNKPSFTNQDFNMNFECERVSNTLDDDSDLECERETLPIPKQTALQAAVCLQCSSLELTTNQDIS